MTRGRNSFFLLVLLALLQCFAPLLHAHTHGGPAPAGVHLHDLDGLHAVNGMVSDTPSLTAQWHHAPVIAMASELRQDCAIELANADQPTAPAHWLKQSLAVPSLDPFFSVSPPGGRCCYSHPFSQAPPSAPLVVS